MCRGSFVAAMTACYNHAASIKLLSSGTEKCNMTTVTRTVAKLSYRCVNETRREKTRTQQPHTMPDGEISLCTCYSDGCNGAPKLSGASPFVAPVLRYITQVLYCTMSSFHNYICRYYLPAILSYLRGTF